MLRRHIVLLIVIRPSDGDVKPGGPLGTFREEQAMSRHLVSPSPFLSSSSHTTQLHYTKSYTYSHANLNFLQYTIWILVPHVMWSDQAVRELKIDYSTPSIRLARNPKHIIVQWVGIGTHIFNELFKFKTSDERQHWKTASPLLWTVRTSTFSLRSHEGPSLSLQRCHDVQTRILAWNSIWFYVNYIEHVKYFLKKYYVL